MIGDENLEVTSAIQRAESTRSFELDCDSADARHEPPLSSRHALRWADFFVCSVFGNSILERLPIERVYLQGELSGELAGRQSLEAAGVRVVTVAGAGHNVMFDNPDAFAAAVAGRC